MLDLRKKIKIYIKDGVAMYGRTVEAGGFPVFSADTEEEANSLVKTYPYNKSISFEAYARKLSSAFGGQAFMPSISFARKLSSAFGGQAFMPSIFSLVDKDIS